MRSSAQLRVVAPSPAPIDVRQPEDMLGFLFTREAQLLRELADVRGDIQTHRERFAAKHDLMALPRVELLRTRFGPRREGEA